MKTRVILYGENDKPISVLGDNPQEKAKKAWDAIIAFLAINTDDIIRVESVEVWDTEADIPQTNLLITEYPQDGKVNLIGRDKTEAVVMAYDVYKKLTEPQMEGSE